MLSSRGRRKLLDIAENIGLAQSWTAGLNLEAFLADRRTFYAVTRALEIISEASRGIDDDVKLRHPDLPWSDIAGAGNIYRHDYDDVTEARIWTTATKTLGPLLAAVEAELADNP